LLRSTIVVLATEKRGMHRDEEALDDGISRVQGKKGCGWYIPDLSPRHLDYLLLVGGVRVV